jgi:hypothetical protein
MERAERRRQSTEQRSVNIWRCDWSRDGKQVHSVLPLWDDMLGSIEERT